MKVEGGAYGITCKFANITDLYAVLCINSADITGTVRLVMPFKTQAAGTGNGVSYVRLF